MRAGYRCLYWSARLFWFVTRPQTSGGVVAVWSGGRVLLMRSSYRPYYGFPGGFLRRGEAPVNGAARELREELGLTIPAAQLRQAWHGVMTFEHRQDTITIFEASLDAAPDVTPNRREVAWAGWKSPAEALEMNLLPHVRDYLLRTSSR